MAAEAHEQAFGWYSGGGRVKPYSAGGMISEPVFGYGKYSRMPYSFAENGPEQVIAGGASTSGGGLPGPTMYQFQTMIKLMQDQNKLLARQPQGYARALNGAVGNGASRGYFATSG